MRKLRPSLDQSRPQPSAGISRYHCTYRTAESTRGADRAGKGKEAPRRGLQVSGGCSERCSPGGRPKAGEGARLVLQVQRTSQAEGTATTASEAGWPGVSQEATWSGRRREQAGGRPGSVGLSLTLRWGRGKVLSKGRGGLTSMPSASLCFCRVTDWHLSRSRETRQR